MLSGAHLAQADAVLGGRAVTVTLEVNGEARELQTGVRMGPAGAKIVVGKRKGKCGLFS